jgi:hypothetical protein
MDNEEKDFNVEQETAEVEETTTEETTTQEETHEDTVVISKEKFKAMQKKAIAYDASKKAPQNITQNNSLTREEAEEMLLKTSAKLSDEDMDMVKTIAKGKGISLIQATEHTLFKTYQEKVEQERKAEKAKLGVSKGSSISQGKASFTSPGLSEDEHKKLWKESMSK